LTGWLLTGWLLTGWLLTGRLLTGWLLLLRRWIGLCPKGCARSYCKAEGRECNENSSDTFLHL
jgi:hypothetical protein